MRKIILQKPRQAMQSPNRKRKPIFVRLNRGLPILHRYMHEVNKLIFVQDFETASKILHQLSHRYPADYEVQFRRIEVGCRNDNLIEIYREYQDRALQTPQVLALSLAASMAEIRLLELSSNQLAARGELVNPSLKLGPQYDVTGLSTQSEVSKFRPNLRLSAPPDSSIGMRSPLFLAHTFRVSRNPSVPDDEVYKDFPPLPEGYSDLDTDSELGFIAAPAQILAPCVQKALEWKNTHPTNYAGWFVLGCAFEYSGQLSQAIEAWTHALELNSKSVAVLATMAELQQIGAIPAEEGEYAERFEAIDKYLVHGTYETHTELYKEFLKRKKFSSAIASLRCLGDWIQRQRGEVPPEIEVMCLLGAMKAYLLDNNSAAAEACKREAENLTIAVKKSPKNSEQVAFIGQICEEYGLASLARVCFYSILISLEANIDLVIKTASHCVTSQVSLSLKECLKTAYRNHHGHSEIRFYQLVCDLSLSNVNIRGYLDRKNKIVGCITETDSTGALKLINESLRDTNEDAEIHFYLGEILSKIGSMERAGHHYSLMYERDFLNCDSVLHYVDFLLKTREFASAQNIAKKALIIPHISQDQKAKLHLAISTTFFENDEIEKSLDEVNKSLKIDPWNMKHIYLALKVNNSQIRSHKTLPHDSILEDCAHFFDTQRNEMSSEQLIRWVERGQSALTMGYMSYAYLMAQTALVAKFNDDSMMEFYARAAAAHSSRLGAQHILMLTQQKNLTISFGSLAACIVRIYAFSGEWALVEEWLDIAEKSGIDNKFTRAKLFELEALKMAMLGTNLKKAQNLLEGALDVYDSTQKVPPDLGVLHGYLILVQGDLKGGIEKMQSHIGENNSIQSLYFFVKGLERAGILNGAERQNIARLFDIIPTNSLEQKLMEEIYCTVGLTASRVSVNLLC